MENTLVKEMPTEVKEAIVESEFDLDIRVYTLPTDDTKKGPQAIGSVVGCSVGCSYSCSCFTCYSQPSCFTCTCWPNC